MYSPIVYRYIGSRPIPVRSQTIFEILVPNLSQDFHEELDLQEQRLKLETRRSLHLRGYLGVETWLQLFQSAVQSSWQVGTTRR